MFIAGAIAMIERIESARARAADCGTLDAVDRSHQYQGLREGELLTAVNQAWAKIRVNEKTIAEGRREIARLNAEVSRYRFATIALTSVITAVCWEGVKALLPLLFR